MRKLSYFVVFAATLAFAATALAASSTVTVHPGDMHGWVFFDDNTGGPGTGQMVTGPAGQPLGAGSAELTVAGPTDRQALGTAAYAGTPLGSLTELSYWSYQTGPTLAISLQFDVKYRPADTLYGGRLVFEPYQTVGTVPAGWSQWDALNGVWWASRTTAAGSNGLCPQSSPCTWAQVLASWPDAAIGGNLLFKAGGGWAAFTGNVDAFTIGAGGTSTTYDFEPYVLVGPPASKEECKHGGWETFNNPAFTSEKECKQFVHEQKGDE